MKNLKIVWTAVLATVLTVGSIISAVLDNSSMVIALGLGAITMATLASRENL
jgi:hypothetical protein